MPPEPSLLHNVIAAFIVRPIRWVVRQAHSTCVEFIRYAIDEPSRSLWYTVPAVLLFGGMAAFSWGVDQDLWGAPMASAWHREEVARKNLETAKAFLSTHWKEKPRDGYEYEIASSGRALYEERKRKRHEWEEAEARAKKLRDDSVTLIPHMSSITAPDHSFEGWSGWWQGISNLHHLLFHSIYTFPLVPLLLFAIWPAWKASDRRWALFFGGVPGRRMTPITRCSASTTLVPSTRSPRPSAISTCWWLG